MVMGGVEFRMIGPSLGRDFRVYHSNILCYVPLRL